MSHETGDRCATLVGGVRLTTDRVEIDPKIMMGRPVILGTRITVELLLPELADGATGDNLLKAYPRLTRQDAPAAIGYAADTVAYEARRLVSSSSPTSKT